MRKYFKVVGVIVAISVLLLNVGCSKSSNDKTITWWVPNWDEPVAKELVEEFEAENNDIKVEIVVTTWDTMENKIRTALSNKNAPEVITELESRINAYASNELLTNLDSYFDKSLDKNDFITSALEINSYNGSVYGVPFRHDGSGVLYNKDMFEKAGLDPNNFPATWDELMEAAQKLTVDTDNDGTIDQYAMSWPLGNQTNAVTRYIQLLYTHGGSILNEDGTQCTLDSPQAVEAMAKLANTLNNEIAPKSTMELDNTTLRGLFVNEKIALYIGGQFDIAPIQEENPSINLGTAVIPGVDGMGTTTVNGFSLIMPETAKKKDEGWKLIEFISRPENMSRLTATFPGRKSALELDKFNDELLKPFADQLEKGISEPSYANWPQMEKVIYHYMQLVILDNMDVQDAMNNITNEINKIIK